ncbi:MAG TPA: hypothetical protein VES95_14000, partial [Dermatophilaceae bacterium]|nr:hypothetical protein [Dermatophilaceae bacterium]
MLVGITRPGPPEPGAGPDIFPVPEPVVPEQEDGAFEAEPVATALGAAVFAGSARIAAGTYSCRY